MFASALSNWNRRASWFMECSYVLFMVIDEDQWLNLKKYQVTLNVIFNMLLQLSWMNIVWYSALENYVRWSSSMFLWVKMLRQAKGKKKKEKKRRKKREKKKGKEKKSSIVQYNILKNELIMFCLLSWFSFALKFVSPFIFSPCFYAWGFHQFIIIVLCFTLLLSFFLQWIRVAYPDFRDHNLKTAWFSCN